MRAILLHWSQNASTNQFLCYTHFCDPPQSVNQDSAVFFFYKRPWVWSVDRHEVVHVRKTCTSLKRSVCYDRMPAADGSQVSLLWLVVGLSNYAQLLGLRPSITPFWSLKNHSEVPDLITFANWSGKLVCGFIWCIFTFFEILRENKSIHKL